MLKLTDGQLDWLAERILDHEPSPKGGRPPADKRRVMQGIELIAPHRANRKHENYTQDGRPLRRYKRRWTVERITGWIQHFRRPCIRSEKSTTLFQGFLHLRCTVLLFKEVLG